MSKILGIDLGTTFSAMATIDETGRSQIVNNQDGEGITPSCVEYVKEEEKMIVGTEARRSLGKANVFGRFKMEMGTDKKYSYGDKTFTPKQLSLRIPHHRMPQRFHRMRFPASSLPMRDGLSIKKHCMEEPEEERSRIGKHARGQIFR